MQLLFEEFFRKLFKVGKGLWPIRILIKLAIFLLIGGFLFLIAYSYLTGNYTLLILILGILIIAEGSHYIRKSREKAMIEKSKEKKKTKEEVKEILKDEKSKNKGLLNSDMMKNRGLLK